MKTRLLESALCDLVTLAGLDGDIRAWVEEMQGGFLIDAGSARDTLLANADEAERMEIIERVGSAGLLVLDDSLANLVFVFGPPGDLPEVLLHALAGPAGWLVRLVYCGMEEGGYAFCPVTGTVDYRCEGIQTGGWPPGGTPDKSRPFSAFVLMDFLLTGMVGLRKPRTARQTRNMMLPIPQRLCADLAA